MRPKPVILLAEDDDDFLLIIKLALQHAGFSGSLQAVQTAGDLILRVRDGEEPDLVVLDLHNAQNDWPSTLRALKGEGRHPGIPVYVFTTFRDLETRPLESFPGCVYLRKPMSFPEWCACMQEVLAKALAFPGGGW